LKLLLAGGRQVELVSRSPAQTRRLGERWGRRLRGGEVFAVCGDLGAGKTCFIQGLARGLGVRDPYLSSPTFVFIQKYAGRWTLYHVDLYRIDRASDAEGLGLLECFDQKSVVAVEWAEKAREFLPPLRITLEIKNRGGSERRLLFHVPAEFGYLIKT
jgi:tRNA threonylcarbamoyladenosine biosynthesis protein TsaE